MFKKHKRIRCDGCGIGEYINNMYLVIDAIYLCNQCVHNILSIYIYTHAIKCLCPHCPDNEYICTHCNIKMMLQKLKNGK